MDHQVTARVQHLMKLIPSVKLHEAFEIDKAMVSHVSKVIETMLDAPVPVEHLKDAMPMLAVLYTKNNVDAAIKEYADGFGSAPNSQA